MRSGCLGTTLSSGCSCIFITRPLEHDDRSRYRGRRVVKKTNVEEVGKLSQGAPEEPVGILLIGSTPLTMFEEKLDGSVVDRKMNG